MFRSLSPLFRSLSRFFYTGGVLLLILGLLLSARYQPVLAGVWDGTSLRMSIVCLESGAFQVTITNENTEVGMTEPSEWRLEVNGSQVDLGTVQLGPGASTVLVFGPFPNQSIQFEVDQPGDYPGDSLLREQFTCEVDPDAHLHPCAADQHTHASHADQYPYEHTHQHGDQYPYQHTHEHPYPDTYEYANEHLHRHTDQYADVHTHQHRYQYPNKHPYSHPDHYPWRADVDQHTHQHYYRHAIQHPDQHRYQHPNEYSDQHSDEYPDKHANEHTHAAHASGSESFQYPHAYRHPFYASWKQPDGYAHTHTADAPLWG